MNTFDGDGSAPLAGVGQPPGGAFPSEAEDWTLVLRPRRPWFDLRLYELWRFRELILLFIWRDFVAYYKQTILGPLWYLIQPLLVALTFTFVFGRVAGLSTDGLPRFLFYMSGTVAWNFFAACLTHTSNTFTAHAGLFGKVYFPRLVVPISILGSNLIMLLIQFIQFLAFLAYFMWTGADVRPNAWVCLTPLLLLLLAGLGLGFGIIVSALTTRYRDLQFVVSFGVQLWMFCTPIIFPLSEVPVPYRALIVANPVTSIIECFRCAYLGAGSVDVLHVGYSLAVMCVVLFIGCLMFNRVEQTFMDTV